jgi:hypothetical protein
LLILSEARQLHVSFTGGHDNMLHRQLLLLLLLAISKAVVIKRHAPIIHFACFTPQASTSCGHASRSVLAVLLLLLPPLSPFPAQIPCCVHKRNEPSNAQDAD